MHNSLALLIKEQAIYQDQFFLHFYYLLVKFFEHFCQGNRPNITLMLPHIHHLLHLVLIPCPNSAATGLNDEEAEIPNNNVSNLTSLKQIPLYQQTKTSAVAFKGVSGGPGIMQKRLNNLQQLDPLNTKGRQLPQI